MSKSPQSPIHPKLQSLLDAWFPGHAESPEIQRRLAAEVDDDFDPDIDDGQYFQLLRHKMEFVLGRDTQKILSHLSALRNELMGEYLDLRFDRTKGWLLDEVTQFKSHVFAERYLDQLEIHLLKRFSESSGIPPPVSPTARSQLLRSHLENNFILEVENLPQALVEFVLKEFPDRERRDPFWRRVQTHVAPFFQKALLDCPEYSGLLKLQLRHCAFGEASSSLESDLVILRERIDALPDEQLQIKTMLQVHFQALNDNRRSGPAFGG